MGVKATRVDNIFEDDLEHAPGTYEFADNSTHIIFVCPCGCGDILDLPVNKGVKVDRKWLWNGNEESPTLSPSIRRLSGCMWHGWLRNGVFESA